MPKKPELLLSDFILLTQLCSLVQVAQGVALQTASSSSLELLLHFRYNCGDRSHRENPVRKIIHIDMDAFYAAVEQRDHPSYRGQPLAVGGSPEQRGVVCAASYEARTFGIHSAMPARLAKQKCPTLILVPPRFAVYRSISQQIHHIFQSYTDWVEPVALDEAYLDVTQPKSSLPYASAIARQIKADILSTTGLTATAGVSINKFLAKMASGLNKPNGLTVILPEQAEAFVEGLAIEQFHGIGRVTALRLHEMGIHTGVDLKRCSLTQLVQQFGKVGRFYYNIARATDDRPVEANRVRKSIGAETSFAQDLEQAEEMRQALASIAQTLYQRLQEQQTGGRTLTLKVKFADYQQITRSRTILTLIRDPETILSLATELLAAIDLSQQSVRLLGISLSNLASSQMQVFVQLPLFKEKQRSLFSGSDGG